MSKRIYLILVKSFCDCQFQVFCNIFFTKMKILDHIGKGFYNNQIVKILHKKLKYIFLNFLSNLKNISLNYHIK